jgi:hypothetical protein
MSTSTAGKRSIVPELRYNCCKCMKGDNHVFDGIVAFRPNLPLS